MNQTPYTDINTVKAFLDIDPSDTSQDAFFSTIIPMVQSFIEQYTGRTFGWGDVDVNGAPLENAATDYSNTDNLGISALSLAGNLLTITTMGPNPWQVGAKVAVYGSATSAYNGVWAVTARNSSSQLVVDISTSEGALSTADKQTNATSAGSNFYGYIGNYVTNYKYIQQEAQDGIVGSEVWLRNMDIRSVESVTIGSRSLAQPVELSHAQYMWRDDGRLFLGGAYFNTYNSAAYGNNSDDNSFMSTLSAGYQTITVSYWCGYIGVPPEIALAATDLVMAYYTLRKGMGLYRERVGDYEVQYDLSFRKLLKEMPDSLNTLNRYKRRHV